MQISTRSYCYLLLWFGLIVLGSILTPYFSNDYRYFMVQGTDDMVGSFSDILVSQFLHYFEWGGRTVAHVIAQTLLWWGKPTSAVVQGLCYILLILFIYYNAYGIKPTLRLRFNAIFAISIMLFLQLRVFGEVVFNVVSSANYLYTTTIVLMFLLPYRISMERELELNPLLLWPLVLLLGVLAGWSNENTAAAVATGLGLYLLYRVKTHQLRFWQCVGYLGFLTGFALMIFAPGNQARLDSMEDKGFDYIEHTLGAVYIFGESLIACALLIGVVLYLYLKVRRHFLQYTLAPIYHGAMWFIYTGFFSLFLMVFSPNFPARAATPFTVFLIVGMVGLSELILERFQRILPYKISRILTMASAVFVGAALINALYGAVVLNNDNRVREAEILKQLEEGQKNLVVSPMHVQTYKYIYVGDVRANPEYWTNKIVREFLHVDSIVRRCDYPSRGLGHDFVFFQKIYSDEDCSLPTRYLPTEIAG